MPSSCYQKTLLADSSKPPHLPPLHAAAVTLPTVGFLPTRISLVARSHKQSVAESIPVTTKWWAPKKKKKKQRTASPALKSLGGVVVRDSGPRLYPLLKFDSVETSYPKALYKRIHPPISHGVREQSTTGTRPCFPEEDSQSPSRSFLAPLWDKPHGPRFLLAAFGQG